MGLMSVWGRQSNLLDSMPSRFSRLERRIEHGSSVKLGSIVAPFTFLEDLHPALGSRDREILRPTCGIPSCIEMNLNSELSSTRELGEKSRVTSWTQCWVWKVGNRELPTQPRGVSARTYIDRNKIVNSDCRVRFQLGLSVSAEIAAEEQLHKLGSKKATKAPLQAQITPS